jgi:hypothetical protein
MWFNKTHAYGTDFHKVETRKKKYSTQYRRRPLVSLCNKVTATSEDFFYNWVNSAGAVKASFMASL